MPQTFKSFFYMFFLIFRTQYEYLNNEYCIFYSKPEYSGIERLLLTQIMTFNSQMKKRRKDFMPSTLQTMIFRYNYKSNDVFIHLIHYKVYLTV